MYDPNNQGRIAVIHNLAGLILSAMTASQMAKAAQDQSATAYRNGFAGLNGYQNANAPPRPPVVEVRTPEEIQAQLEARMAELDAEALERDRKAQAACTECRHFDGKGYCTNKLLIGFNPPEWTGYSDGHMICTTLRLCGPEKALWEPKPPKIPLWHCLIAWFTAPWREAA